MSNETKPNVGATMTIIHKAISRGLDESSKQSLAFLKCGYPDEAARDGFATYVGSLHKVINSHHLGEEALAFPYLKIILPQAPFDELLSEHHEMEVVLDELQTMIGSLSSPGQGSISLDRLSRVISRLSDFWHPHIEKEEFHLYDPKKTEQLMSVDEHIELNMKLAQHAAQLGDMEFKVPFILYNLTPEDRDIFARGLPPVMVQELVPIVWQPKWSPMKRFMLE